MDRVRAETQGRPADPREGAGQVSLAVRVDRARDARQGHVRAERLVVEGHAALAEALADARAEPAELPRPVAGAEPDDVRTAALGEAAHAVEDDVERRGATRGVADRLGGRGEELLGDVADESEGQVEERRRDVPERGKDVPGKECRRALGGVCGELDRDEEADRRRLDPRADGCRLDLIGDQQCEERDREDHGEHGQHGHPHRLVQLEALPGRLDQLAHGLWLKQSACRMSSTHRSGNGPCRAM